MNLCRFVAQKGEDRVYCPHPKETQTIDFCKICATMRVAGRLAKLNKKLEKLDKLETHLGTIVQRMKFK